VYLGRDTAFVAASQSGTALKRTDMNIGGKPDITCAEVVVQLHFIRNISAETFIALNDVSWDCA
jgi:hypothetical protein